MGDTEYHGIVGLLTGLSLEFEQVEHEAVRTSQEAAAVRGTKLSEGIKALVVKFRRAAAPGKDWFAVIDLPADRMLDWKKAKALLQASELGFASEDEVVQHTGCEPGGVPPLGHSQALAVIVDPSVFGSEYSEFNAGLKTRSIRIKSSLLKRALDSVGVAYLQVAKQP